ncbi:hypothetical protein B0H16DRAFT_1738308 [Mycena metata]|uniref:Uncharacterized protein n=1 Tax=Mycena metata TaxID=1033252 RepID=A0AAD7HIM6_9AGAR|nr:hypothetical protein B0H16DRAFT_1738308 [Mycena metata]
MTNLNPMHRLGLVLALRLQDELLEDGVGAGDDAGRECQLEFREIMRSQHFCERRRRRDEHQHPDAHGLHAPTAESEQLGIYRPAAGDSTSSTRHSNAPHRRQRPRPRRRRPSTLRPAASITQTHETTQRLEARVASRPAVGVRTPPSPSADVQTRQAHTARLPRERQIPLGNIEWCRASTQPPRPSTPAAPASAQPPRLPGTNSTPTATAPSTILGVRHVSTRTARARSHPNNTSRAGTPRVQVLGVSACGTAAATTSPRLDEDRSYARPQQHYPRRTPRLPDSRSGIIADAAAAAAHHTDDRSTKRRTR